MSTSNQSISDIADFYGIFTYKDDLIHFGIENHDSWRHRELALRKDPFIKKYIKKLDEAINCEKPITKPDIFGGNQGIKKDIKDYNAENKELAFGVKPKEPIEPDTKGTNITIEWDREKWSKLLIKMKDKARLHSFSVIQLYNAPPYWRVFCSREIKSIKYNNQDVPVSCIVEWTRELPHSQEFVNYSEEITFFTGDLLDINEDFSYGLLVPFGVPETEDCLGEFDLDDKWSLAVNIRYALLDIVNNSAKSSGFYWLMYGSAIKATQRQDLVNAVDMAGASRAIGAKENVLKDLKAMFPAKPEFTILALAEHIKLFAMSCDMPLAFFRSESEKGSMFGDQSGDDIQINKKMRYIFSQFKESIKTLIKMRWGIELEDIEPFILESEEEEIEVPIDDKEDNKEKEIEKNE